MYRAKNPEAEQVFAGLSRALGPAWVTRMTQALAASGCPKPEQTARSLLAFNSGYDNQSVSHAFGFLEAVPPSTLSSRFAAVELNKFVTAFNRGLEEDTRAWLQAFPPDDGRVILVGDGHDEEYHETRHPTGRIKLQRTRWHWRTRASADNKATRNAAKFLFLIAKWYHQGRSMKSMMMVRLIGPLDLAPSRHIAFMAGPVQRLATRYEVLALDRYYGSAKVLRSAYEAGAKLGVRLRISAYLATWALDPVSGKGINLIAELHRTAAMKLPIVREEIQATGTRTGTRFLAVRRRNLRVRMWSGGPVLSIVLEAALKPVESAHGRTWACNLEDSRLLCFPAGMTASQIVRLYAERESIEVLFSQSTHDRSSCRPKTVESLLIQYFAYLYRIQLGILASFRLSLACPSGRFRGNAVQRYSAYAMSRQCLGIQRAFTPPEGSWSPNGLRMAAPRHTNRRSRR